MPKETRRRARIMRFTQLVGHFSLLNHELCPSSKAHQYSHQYGDRPSGNRSGSDLDRFRRTVRGSVAQTKPKTRGMALFCSSSCSCSLMCDAGGFEFIELCQVIVVVHCFGNRLHSRIGRIGNGLHSCLVNRLHNGLHSDRCYLGCCRRRGCT